MSADETERDDPPFAYAGTGPGEQRVTSAPDAGADEAPDDGTGGDRGLRRSDLIVGAAVLVALLVAAVTFTLLTRDDPPSDVVVEGAPTDDFNRPQSRDTVGVAANGDSWDPVAGVWGIDGAQVYLATADLGGARNLLTLDMGSADGTVSAVFSRVRLGAGMVFRYQSPQDFWVILPAPDYGTWIVQHIVDDETVVNENIGLADSPDGTTVSLTLAGTLLKVQINDADAVELEMDDSTDATVVGLTSLGYGSGEARWDDFYADPAT
jgi:hypothetical protein